MQLISFLIFTFGVLALTMFWTRKDNQNTSTAYFLGNRSLTAIVICGSLLLTNLSTEQLLGMNGESYNHGLVIMSWEILAAFSIILLALFFLPHFLKRGITTAPEFLEARFDKTLRFNVSILFLLGYTFIFLPVVLFTGAKAMSGLFDLPKILNMSEQTTITLTVIVLGIIGSIYAIFGGLKGVAVSDTLNGIGLFTGGLIIPYIGLKVCGNGSFIDGINVLMESQTAKFTVKGAANTGLPWETIFTGFFVITTFYWCTNQAIIQRALAAKSLAEGQKGVLLCALIKIFVPIIVVLPGIIAYHLYSQELSVSGGADGAYPLLVRKLLPTWLSGFFAAVIFGAILSSFNSGLNSAGTLFALDIYKGKIKPDSTELEQVKTGRNFSIVIAIFSIILAPLLLKADGIFNFLQMYNTIYMVPIISVFMAGFFSKRVTAKMANIGLYISLGINIILTVLSNFEKIDIHWLHRAGGVFVFSLLIMNLCKGEKIEFPEKIPENYDITPWKHAKKMSIFIVAIILTLYTFLWK